MIAESVCDWVSSWISVLLMSGHYWKIWALYWFLKLSNLNTFEHRTYSVMPVRVFTWITCWTFEKKADVWISRCIITIRMKSGPDAIQFEFESGMCEPAPLIRIGKWFQNGTTLMEHLLRVCRSLAGIRRKCDFKPLRPSQWGRLKNSSGSRSNWRF